MKDEEKDGSVEPDEEIVEFEFNDDGEEDLKKTLKKLRADLKVAKAEKEEYLTGWQKERADFANYRKQEDDRRANYSESLREHMLTRFLSILDSFNMAFSNKEVWEKVDLNWRIGIQHIYSQLYSIFEEYGIKEIGAEKEDFNPSIHESIEIVATDKKAENHKIAQVIQKGYKLGDRVIRPARVHVFEFKNGESTE